MTDTRYRPNVVIQSRSAHQGLVIAALENVCLRPLHRCHLPTPLDLPCEAASTVLLWDAAHLTPQQQAELHDWIARCRPAGQIIAVTSARLYDLVEAGRFDPALFYRLNMATMNVTEGPG
jgi:hypothetical protein